MINKYSSTADVAFQNQGLGKDRAVEEDGVAAFALIGGNDNLRLGPAVSLDDLMEGLGSKERLVSENDERCVDLWMESGESFAQRTSHSLCVGVVDDDIDSFEKGLGKLLANGFSRSAENEDD